MAWLPSLHGLTLLLPLLSPFWTPTRAGDRKVAVLAPREVHGSWGDTVNLMCNLLPMESEIPQVKQIRWERLEPWGELTTVAEFDWVQGPRILEPDRVQFIAAGKDLDMLDASLTLTDLHPDDDANYTCEVTTFQHGIGKASTWLRVFYAPQVSISLYDNTRKQGHREISLSCDARGNPEPEGYMWSTTTGPLPSYAVPQGTWLLLQPSEESINITFICRVSNTLGMAQVSIRVLLSGSSRTLFWSLLALTIVLIVGLTSVVLYFGHYRKSHVSSPKHSPSPAADASVPKQSLHRVQEPFTGREQEHEMDGNQNNIVEMNYHTRCMGTDVQKTKDKFYFSAG